MSIRITDKKNLPEWMKYEKSKGTEFGEPVFKKYGKEIKVQDYIESNREDTEIIPCLEKYGCLKPMERSAQEIYGDFTEYNDLRGNLEKAEKSKEMWNQLPSSIKNQFNNDMNEFVDRGMDWAKAEIAKQEKAKAETVVEKTNIEQKGE